MIRLKGEIISNGMAQNRVGGEGYACCPETGRLYDKLHRLEVMEGCKMWSVWDRTSKVDNNQKSGGRWLTGGFGQR